ncbi:hypothetical protein CEXT_247261 [Caerostris extrusa]|uniref:Uncharacterized protein n=1 Tax=Caerostris extrusa TaxID=172846 RepID=A0AAV4MGE0_CAEEX|nr:hypothetical protein CEXT_247261 [Caerostris extrusa]
MATAVAKFEIGRRLSVPRSHNRRPDTKEDPSREKCHPLSPTTPRALNLSFQEDAKEARVLPRALFPWL